MVASIPPAQLAELHRRGDRVMLIDVRTPAEYGDAHVDFARNVPLDRLSAREIAGLAGDGPVYFVCKSGTRSQKACEQMRAAGVERVVSVEGGTAACEAAGMSVIRGRKAMSLERQVRIAAGSLVAVGAALAAFGPDAPVDWRSIGAGLAGFVGCGLMFAGVTDTCGMALLLARMPWNQTRSSGTSCCSRLLLAGLLAAAAGTAAAQHTQDSLDVVKTAMAEQKAVLVDVREPDEWQKGHVVGARLVPLSTLERGATADEVARSVPKGAIVYTYCMVGGRSVAAARFLRGMGYDVRPLKPGYPDLARAGFPTATGK
ncbi:MAG: rhodanese-like domain-containing protein [Planctomycetaceae bacterium]